jgi:hypothetical protein
MFGERGIRGGRDLCPEVGFLRRRNGQLRTTRRATGRQIAGRAVGFEPAFETGEADLKGSHHRLAGHPPVDGVHRARPKIDRIGFHSPSAYHKLNGFDNCYRALM